MSLTLGTGPLSRSSQPANYTFESPAHRLLFEPFGPRLRAVVADRVVLDTTRAHLLHETGILPVAYAPLEDFDQTLLERTETSTHCPFKGDASYWSLRIGDRVVEDAVWAYEDPLEPSDWLRGFAALDARKADSWLVEDEPTLGHLRDPYHRVDVHDSSRRVEVRAGGEVIADSAHPKMLFETSLPGRPYIPRADIRPGVLERSDRRTVCPYKGEATYWHVHAGGQVLRDAAWSYETPLPESLRAAACVSFDGEGIEVSVEG
jgi:uncharacterized protein (DUF427 family)